ncbi:MAG TPA: N-acetyltransferase [Gemmataceae bacterium]|nr:N-acetyltransferase [Gemmataceae bacterium]
MHVRPEAAADAPAIFAVHAAAFPTDAEARLVDRLRSRADGYLGFVAEVGDEVVGHVVFSPVSVVDPDYPHRGLGLAPVGVLPAHQRRGIGGALIREGLAACRSAGWPFVVVLGHSEYYPRFGFRRAGDVGLWDEYDGGDAFMVIELMPGGLPSDGGLVKYGPDFAEWS